MIAGDAGQAAQARREPYRTMVGLIAATGLRIGELPGRQVVGALDLESGSLRFASPCSRGSSCHPRRARRSARFRSDRARSRRSRRIESA